MLSALFLVALLCTVSAAPRKTIQAPLLAADSRTAIPNEYLVRLNPETTDEQVEAHLNKVNQMLTVSTVAESQVMHTWHINSFRGYSVRMDDQTLEKLREMEDIMHVERNQEVHAYCETQNGTVWGLCRTTFREWSRDPGEVETNYTYDDGMSGEGVVAYVIDTGVFLGHNDFEGRAEWGVDCTVSGAGCTVPTNDPGDGNGHGTHVAGTIAGSTYGLAKKATIVAVRVLNEYGSGTTAGVIAGINWVADDHSERQEKKSVANLSLGGSKSDELNKAIEEAFEKGVIMVSAAGNEGKSACNVSPASANGITVAASDSDDVFASFSNYDADCVDIIAPGVGIKAPWIRNPDDTNTISGTSMASPHVAGVLAKFMSGREDPEKPTYEGIRNHLRSTATKDAILLGGRPVDNLLVFMDCQK